jgi:flavodoxin
MDNCETYYSGDYAMKKVLIAYDSHTGRTQKMANYIAEGVRSGEHEVDIKDISEIKSDSHLGGYDGYVFGCPTYFKDMTDQMKTFLFLARKAGLDAKVGGAFGSYTHIGSAPEIIHDTMMHVFNMNMKDIGPFNVKEQIIDSGRAEQPCQDYGKAIGRLLS